MYVGFEGFHGKDYVLFVEKVNKIYLAFRDIFECAQEARESFKQKQVLFDVWMNP